MAVTTQKGNEVTNLDAVPSVVAETTKLHGRLRFAYFSHTQSGAGDATSSVEIARLPAGSVRVLGAMCKIKHNWTTSSATMDIGWDAYTDLDGDSVAADPNGMDDGLNVDSAGTVSTICTVLTTDNTKLFESKGKVSIRLTSQDVALAASSTVYGYLVYVVD